MLGGYKVKQEHHVYEVIAMFSRFIQTKLVYNYFKLVMKEVFNYSFHSSSICIYVLVQLLKLSIFVCDLCDINCIFGMDGGKIAGFITCSQTGRTWFNVDPTGKPQHISRQRCNVVCHL